MVEMLPYSSHLSDRQSHFYNMMTHCFQKSKEHTHRQSFHRENNSSGLDRGPRVKRYTKKVAKTLEKVLKLLYVQTYIEEWKGARNKKSELVPGTY